MVGESERRLNFFHIERRGEGEMVNKKEGKRKSVKKRKRRGKQKIKIKINKYEEKKIEKLFRDINTVLIIIKKSGIQFNTKMPSNEIKWTR